MGRTPRGPRGDGQRLVADRPRDLLVAGHINVDRFLRVDRFPEADRTVPVRESRAELGGTATNIALTATRYGVATGLVARLGEPFPATLDHQLRASGIDLRGVARLAAEATPTCYIVEDARGEQRTLIEQGAMRDRVRGSLPVGAWVQEYAWMHVTTGPPDLQLALVRFARRAGLRVAADPAQEIRYRWDRRSLRALLHDSELLFGNTAEIDEAVAILGVRDAGALVDLVPLVIRTEGRRGVTAFARGSRIHVSARTPKQVRTVVGAGDAFRGGFYAAWFAGQPTAGCLDAGVRAAARWLEGKR
jgi:adenosine kinase